MSMEGLVSLLCKFQCFTIQQYDAFQASSAPTIWRRNLSVMSLEVRCTRFCHAADPQQYNSTNKTNTTTSPLEVAIYLIIIPNKAAKCHNFTFIYYMFTSRNMKQSARYGTQLQFHTIHLYVQTDSCTL